MTATVLMIVGASVWLAGELLGVAHTRAGKTDTTTEYVRRWRNHAPIVGRVVLGALLVVLAGHLIIDWP